MRCRLWIAGPDTQALLWRSLFQCSHLPWSPSSFSFIWLGGREWIPTVSVLSILHPQPDTPLPPPLDFILWCLCFLASIGLPDGQQALFSVNRTWKQPKAVTDPLPGFQFQLCHQRLVLFLSGFARDLCEVIRIISVKLPCKGNQLCELWCKHKGLRKHFCTGKRNWGKAKVGCAWCPASGICEAPVSSVWKQEWVIAAADGE